MPLPLLQSQVRGQAGDTSSCPWLAPALELSEPAAAAADRLIASGVCCSSGRSPREQPSGSVDDDDKTRGDDLNLIAKRENFARSQSEYVSAFTCCR